MSALRSAYGWFHQAAWKQERSDTRQEANQERILIWGFFLHETGETNVCCFCDKLFTVQFRQFVSRITRRPVCVLFMVNSLHGNSVRLQKAPSHPRVLKIKVHFLFWNVCNWITKNSHSKGWKDYSSFATAVLWRCYSFFWIGAWDWDNFLGLHILHAFVEF